MDGVIRIADFHGLQVDRTEANYPSINEQYATSSYQVTHDMFPNLIVRPNGDQDVITAVKWARDNKVAVAVKSGGHQYSGASSTNGQNIQIDLSSTYKDFKVMTPTVTIASDRAWVLIGVSVTMLELNGHLKDNKLFVPTGQCAGVGVGGHGQTGGYGQLGRSFGLFGDNIRLVRIVDYDGQIQDVSKESDPELFHSILGGSPGNFGIITHYVVEVFQADSYLGTVAGPHGYKGPHAIKAFFIYSRDILVKLLHAIAKMADDPTFPRGFDLCVTVFSIDFDISSLFDSMKDASTQERVQQQIKNVLEDDFLNFLDGLLPPLIILYAQWCPTSPQDKYDANVDAWFKIFRDLNSLLWDWCVEFNEFDMDMANMTGQWLLRKEREFDLPYVKRTYSTSSTTLTRDNWAETVADRIDHIYNHKYYREGKSGETDFERYNRCKLSVQIQNFGGNNSQFHANKDNGTSYSWRDSTVVQTMDCFHDPDDESKAHAESWQAENDQVMIGPNSPFSKQDRRVLWGSWGDWDMKNVWRCYYEDEAKYQRLGRARAKADPHGTFTANPFAVEAVRT